MSAKVVAVGIPGPYGLNKNNGTSLQIQEDGSNVGTPSSVKNLNFIGAAVSFASDTVDVEITQHFLGKYTTLLALQTAHPTALDGDYAIVDTGIGGNARQYVWDSQDGWVDSGDIKSGTTTDQLTEGSTNLFFSNARALAAAQDQINLAKIQSIIIAASDESTALTVGTSKITFRMPYAFTLTAVRASLTTAQTSGSIFTVDINEGGTTILSTKLTIDNTEKTSTTAATAAVISDVNLADDAEITIDIDQVGDGTAKGLKITLIGTRA